MKSHYQVLLCLLLVLLPGLSKGQFYEVSQGPGYNQSVYYDLSTRSATSVPLNAWDIAFGVSARSWAIFVNEGVGTSRGAPAPFISLYASEARDFASADTSDIVGQVYNPEYDWNSGAFNRPALASDQFDLGWGSYSPMDQSVQGTRIFFIQLRDNSWRKLRINSLAGGTYSFTHARLDGSDERTISFSKSEFPGQTLAYYSFAESAVKSLEPERQPGIHCNRRPPKCPC